MDSDQLRLILAVVGVAVVLGIYLWDRYKRSSHGYPKIRMARNLEEPDFDIPDRDDDIGEVRVRRPASARQEPTLDAAPSGSTVVEPVAPSAPSVDAEKAPELEPAEPIEPSAQASAKPDTASDAPSIVAAETRQQDRKADAQSETMAKPKASSEPKAEVEPQLDPESEPQLESFAAVDPEPDLSALGLQLEKPESRDKPASKSKAKNKPKNAEAPPAEDQFTLDLGFSANEESDYMSLDPALRDEVPRLIVQINVVTKSQPISYADLNNAAAQVDLEFGDMQIFHRQTDAGQVLFSMANAVEPGVFPAKAEKNFSTPGVTLFTQLPGAREGLAVYADMLFTAERLAALFDGVLQDETRNKLTKQRIAHTREAIMEHSRQLKLLRSRR